MESQPQNPEFSGLILKTFTHVGYGVKLKLTFGSARSTSSLVRYLSPSLSISTNICNKYSRGLLEKT